MLNIEELFVKEIIEEIERIKVYRFRNEETWRFACSNQILLSRELDKMEDYLYGLLPNKDDYQKEIKYEITKIAYQILIESLRSRLSLILISEERAKKDFEVFKVNDIIERFSAMKMAPKSKQKKMHAELFIDYTDLDHVLNQDYVIKKVSEKILPVLRPIQKSNAMQPIDPIRILSISTSTNLIMMNHQNKIKIEMINVIYDVLAQKYIDCKYDIFTRHFLDSNTPMIKIQWKQNDRSLSVFLYWLAFYSIISVADYADTAVKHFSNQKGKAFVASTVKVSKAQGSIDKYPELERLISRLRTIKDSN